MRMGLRKVLVSLAVAAFAVLSLAVRDAMGQSGGICVMNTQQITFQCASGCTSSGCGCYSTTKVLEPSGGTYGAGQLYDSAVTQCCGSPVSYISNPHSQCVFGGNTPTKLALGTRRVFVRDCGGHFRLVSVGV